MIGCIEFFGYVEFVGFIEFIKFIEFFGFVEYLEFVGLFEFFFVYFVVEVSPTLHLSLPTTDHLPSLHLISFIYR